MFKKEKLDKKEKVDRKEKVDKKEKVDRPRKNSARYRKLEELILPNAKLRFCPEQLQNLNYIFQNKLQHYMSENSEKSLLLARSVTERLIQRLVCGAGSLDSRFSSKYLVSINGQKHSNVLSKNMEYLVRLDCLSTPPIYDTDIIPKYSITESDADYPPAYARVRLQSSTFKLWGEFSNSSGYLRRDRVQAKYVELLATAAAQDTPNSPLQVDETSQCGIPGKVVDAATLHHILAVNSEHHVYYGPGGNVPRFPDPRDFRLAIVDEPAGIRLRVEFLSPALCNISINVRLLLAIGVDAWPASTDLPARVSLGHTDCLLYHHAALTGMFLVGYGVQSSAWQIRVPAAEYTILNHYGPNSTIRTIMDILHYLLEEIESYSYAKSQHVTYKILNRYILMTTLFDELEDNSVDALTDILNWSPLYLSTHVLKILDKLMSSLRSQRLPNYFFRKSNLLVNPGHLCEDDFYMEANNIKALILRVFDESLMSTSGNKEYDKMMLAQQSEMVLLHKWKDLIDGLLPPPGTRGRRFCFAGQKNKLDIAHTQYTTRQLEYIGMLLKSMLCVKQYILQDNNTMHTEHFTNPEDFVHESDLEDVIFILVNIMDQACDQYLRMQTNPTIEKNRPKIRNQYHKKTSKLVEIIRKDKDMLDINFGDDLLLVKVILKWLYKAMDHNKKNLGPILRPYLSNLFSTSHAISWHLETIKQRICKDEIEALGVFSKLVNSASITPAKGLIDAVNKNWMWAKHMLSMVEKNTLRVVFICDKSSVYRHILSLPSYQRKTSEPNCRTLNCSRERSEIRRQVTLPNRNYFNSLLKERASGADDDLMPQHEKLKNFSPMTFIFDKLHRKGEHRGCGDIFKALMSMQKLNMFQEVTSTLPKEDRFKILDMINELQTVKTRRAAARKWSTTLPQKNKVVLKPTDYQKYTPKEESAGIRIENVGIKLKDPVVPTESKSHTLIGKCRAARIREDSNVFFVQDNLKIRTLLNKSESFKY